RTIERTSGRSRVWRTACFSPRRIPTDTQTARRRGRGSAPPRNNTGPAGGGFAVRRLILWIVVIVFVVAVLGPVLFGFGAKAAQPKLSTAALIEKKVTGAQKLLAGLDAADLAAVGEQARELSALSERAEFRVLQTPQYERHTGEFRRALDDIQRGVAQ